MPQNYRIIFITRTGRLKKLSEEKIFNNEFLSDETILDELCGAQEAVRSQKIFIGICSGKYYCTEKNEKRGQLLFTG